MMGRANGKLQARNAADLQEHIGSRQIQALIQAAAIMREAGDIANAQTLEQHGHRIAKAAESLADSSRVFMAVRSNQRVEQEHREQEACRREDAQVKEIDALYRLAKEESVTKEAEVAVAREETRRKLLEVEAQRTSHR